MTSMKCSWNRSFHPGSWLSSKSSLRLIVSSSRLALPALVVILQKNQSDWLKRWIMTVNWVRNQMTQTLILKLNSDQMLKTNKIAVKTNWFSKTMKILLTKLLASLPFFIQTSKQCQKEERVKS